MEGWALAVAALALLLSVLVFLKQFPLQRRVTEIEESRRQEEVASRLVADVTAAIEHEARPGSAISQSTYLVLHNRGPTVASDTDVETEGDGWSLLRDAAILPVSLDAGQRYRIPLVVTVNSAASIEIRIRWRDGRGDRTKSITATY